MHKANAMPSRMTTKKMPKAMRHKHKFRSSRIEAAHNGGFTVTHQMHSNDGMPYGGGEQQHAFSNAGDMHDHLQSVYPDAGQANEREPGEQE